MTTTKPFLLLQLRPEDEASDNEYQAFKRYGNLADEELQRIRVEQVGVPDIDLNSYSGIILGGGPYNLSDTEDQKNDAQKQFEKGLTDLLDNIVAQDFPYLGACIGITLLSQHEGVCISKEKYNEDVGGVSITLTEEGKKDPVLHGVAASFRAFGGHKEACQAVPESAALLASSDTCPVQMIRVKNNVYAAQFHPELDTPDIKVRINIYKHHGYFPPEEAQVLKDKVDSEDVTEPMKILENWVKRYRTLTN